MSLLCPSERVGGLVEQLEELYDYIIETKGFDDQWARRLYKIIHEFHQLYNLTDEKEGEAEKHE